MSLVPLLEGILRPALENAQHSAQHQHYGLNLEDLYEPQHIYRCPVGYIRPWRAESSKKDTGSVIKHDKDQFQANLDVQQFKPEEITVKVTGDNTVTIEGKHEEKQDEHGYISRHFVRRYVLPEGCDVSRVQSRLSSDGVLTVTAPKVKNEVEHREIPITQTGKPAKQIKQGGEEKKNEQ